MLEVKNLCKTYKSKSGVNVNALDNISLSFPKTGMVFILGKSGSGKSTLLNVIGGLDNADSGEILIKGEGTSTFKQSHFDSYRNTYVGFIFQDYNLLDDFTVGANIALAMELQGQKADEKKINSLLEEVDIKELGNRKTNELSGGQQQRVAIARALIKNPKIIMADEPTGALDSATGKQVFETLKKLSETKLILIVSHDRELSELYADRIIELKDGKVISDVTKENKKKQEIQPVEFTNNSIIIEKGYQLTNKDLKQINDYLKQLNDKSSIALKSNSHNFTFKNTDQEKIDKDTSGFELIKSSFSLKNSFKIGSNSLKHKVFRLIVTIFLSIQSFTLFGLADSVAAYSKRNTTVESIQKSAINYASLSKEVGDKNSDYTTIAPLNNEDIDYINKNLDGNYKGVLTPQNETFDLSSVLKMPDTTDSEYSYKEKFYLNIAPKSFTGMAEFSTEDLTNYGFNLLEGSLPTGDDQIAISDFLAECFKTLGYTNQSEETIKIQTVSDLINKTIKTNDKDFKISGIVNTGFDFKRYEEVLTKEISESDTSGFLEQMIYELELKSAIDYSLINTMFVNVGYINKYQSENKTMFVEPTYASVFLSGIWVGKMSLASKHSSNICYFSDKRTIDKNNFVVSPTLLLDIVDMIEMTKVNNIYNEFNSSTIILNKIIKSFTTDLQTNNVDLYNKCAESGKTFDEVVNILTDDYRYVRKPINKTVFKLLDKYVAENVLHEIETAGFDIKNEAFNFELTSYFDLDVNNSVNIIGVCYNTKSNGYNLAIVDDETFNTVADSSFGDYAFAVSNMPKDSNTIKNIYDFSEKRIENGNRVYRYSFVNTITQEISLIDDILVVLKQIFIWIGVFFALFAVLLLANFIASSISYKKKDIGILRALGARGSDVFKIFFSESFIIAMINFVISTSITALLIHIIDKALRENTGILISVIHFSLRQVGFILLISLFVAFIGTFLPVYKIAKKRPVAAIKNSK